MYFHKQTFHHLVSTYNRTNNKHFTQFQALFAGSIPEIISIFKSFPKYNGTHVSDPGRRQENMPGFGFYIRPSSALT